MVPVSLEQIHRFYTKDREIFSRLVLIFHRDPGQSLLVLAFWMCLERMKFPCIVQKLICFPDGMLKCMADEAVICLISLQLKNPPEYPDGCLPLTTLILGRRVSLTYFYMKKFTMISAIKSCLNNVWANNVFTDILSQVYPKQAIFNVPLFGPLKIIPSCQDYVFSSNINWAFRIESEIDDRTMFLTFSRGYPVSETEVIQLFTSKYGDCVETLNMEPSPTCPEQSLYARLVVRDIETVDRILSGESIAKFKINGKHVWARKFERRDSL